MTSISLKTFGGAQLNQHQFEDFWGRGNNRSSNSIDLTYSSDGLPAGEQAGAFVAGAVVTLDRRIHHRHRLSRIPEARPLAPAAVCAHLFAAFLFVGLPFAASPARAGPPGRPASPWRWRGPRQAPRQRAEGSASSSRGVETSRLTGSDADNRHQAAIHQQDEPVVAGFACPGTPAPPRQAAPGSGQDSKHGWLTQPRGWPPAGIQVRDLVHSRRRNRTSGSVPSLPRSSRPSKASITADQARLRLREQSYSVIGPSQGSFS